MKNPVYFYNEGVLDARAFKTFGLSVKEHDNPFGQFGTGFKYAIAILLSHGREITMVTDGESYTFRAKKIDFRGQQVGMVCANDEELGFTTHLGSHWELWQAYRELASNAYDENGGVVRSPDKIPESDTLIVADIGDIKHDDVFYNKDAPRMDMAFVKGVRVMKLPTYVHIPCLLPDSTMLTEDRTIISSDLYTSVLANLITCQDKGTITKCLGDGDCFEMTIPWLYVPSGCSASSQFVKVIDHFAQSGRLHNQLLESLYNKFGTKTVTIGAAFTPSTRQQEMVDWAGKIAEKSGFAISEFPIKYMTNMPDGVMAQARDGEIIITDTMLNRGDKWTILHALIEEWAHLKHGYQDMTRGFQSWIFGQLVEKCVELHEDK